MSIFYSNKLSLLRAGIVHVVSTNIEHYYKAFFGKIYYLTRMMEVYSLIMSSLIRREIMGASRQHIV